MSKLARLDSAKAKLEQELQDIDVALDAIHLTNDLLHLDYDDDQPRDEGGRWSSGGGSGSGPGGRRTPDEVDRQLSGTGRSAAKSEPKEPSKGLRELSERVGKSFTDTDNRKGSGAPKKEAPKSAEKKAEELKGSQSTAHLPDNPEPKIWHGAAKGSKDTETAFLKDGKWHPDRKAIHDKYIQDASKDVPKVDEPTVYMTGGGPASGKTTGLLNNPKAGIPDKSNAAHINADEAKEYLPEFKAGKMAKDKHAASFVHEESSYVAKKGVSEALKNGHHVVFDSTGDSGADSLAKKVQQMRDQGAKKVVANYATLNVDEAIRRSDARAAKSGRFVPHEYLRANHRDVSKTVQGAIEKGIFDNLDVWDTNGKDPVHVATYTKGKGLQVHHKEAWDAFVARGDGKP